MKDAKDVAIRRCRECPFRSGSRCIYYSQALDNNTWLTKPKFCKVISLIICEEVS